MSSDQTSTRASLGRCPAEIINDIFGWFCWHCRNAHYVRRSHTRKTDCKALLALTQTSKLCRDIAMPILFHCSNAHLTSRYIFNVLLCQPKLAQCTRTLFVDFQVSAGYVDAKSTLVEHMAAKNVAPAVFSDQDSSTYWRSVGTSLLLSICSNITRLVLVDGVAHGLCKYSPSLWGTFKCDRLKYLEYRFIDMHEWTPEVLSLLVNASPIVDVLALRGMLNWRCTNSDSADIAKLLPALNNLTEIRVLKYVLVKGQRTSPKLMQDIIEAAQNLQTFKYIANGVTHLQHKLEYGRLVARLPKDVIELLKASRATLKHLVLDFDGKPRPLLPAMFVSPREISRFVQLQTLEIDQVCYCRHLLGKENLEQEEWDRTTYLADLLPTTVTNLTIFWKPKQPFHRCLDCILYLGKRAVAGDFPRLESVTVQCPINSESLYTFQGQKKFEIVGKDAVMVELEGQACRLREAFEGSDVITGFLFGSQVKAMSLRTSMV